MSKVLEIYDGRGRNCDFLEGQPTKVYCCALDNKKAADSLKGAAALIFRSGVITF
ncbi:hypothetical protein JCM15548_1555 [Geofilum rubicundum JCM 15548]|uniref:Uncharacterized protein n=1 Tax=Geofilum rubicundum JCM 15548 TaxID=1236989 RepID=A0A0E9LT47_9BACT|nr:hypothetical protein JCM15548_1555 [Geofilum rubicundum JCM 15548]